MSYFSHVIDEICLILALMESELQKKKKKKKSRSAPLLSSREKKVEDEELGVEIPLC